MQSKYWIMNRVSLKIMNTMAFNSLESVKLFVSAYCPIGNSWVILEEINS